MTVLQETLTLVDQLNVAEKVHVLEHLSTTLKHDLEIEAFKRMSWHEFIDRTAGILADDPIERPPQLPLEERLSDVAISPVIALAAKGAS